MKKRDKTTIAWRFGFTEKDSCVTVPGFENWGRETGESETLGMIRISSCHDDDFFGKHMAVEIFGSCPIAPLTAWFLVTRSLYGQFGIQRIVNGYAYFPLRRNESFVDGAIRIAGELLVALKATLRPGHVASSDWMISNFRISQHTEVYLPRDRHAAGPNPPREWVPIEEYYLRKHRMAA